MTPKTKTLASILWRLANSRRRHIIPAAHDTVVTRATVTFGSNADTYDIGQLGAFLDGIEMQHPEWFDSSSDAAMTPEQKIDHANAQLAKKDSAAIALFGKQEFADEKERERVLKLDPARKLDWANEQIARKRAEGVK